VIDRLRSTKQQMSRRDGTGAAGWQSTRGPILRGTLPRGRRRCLAPHIHWREEAAKLAIVAQKRGQQGRSSELDREDAVCFEFAILGLRVMHGACKTASSAEMIVHAIEDSAGEGSNALNQAGRQAADQPSTAQPLFRRTCTTQGGQRVGHNTANAGGHSGLAPSSLNAADLFPDPLGTWLGTEPLVPLPN
jgi:hypothetical protein